MMSWRAWAPASASSLGYVLVAIAFTWPLPLHLGTHLTGDPGGDTGVYVWNQWVFQHETASGANPLATEQIFSLSQRVDLSQHNYTAFLNVLALPLIPLVGVVASFNVVLLIATVITALCTYGWLASRPDDAVEAGRRPGVRLVAGDGGANDRALQPGGGGAAAGVLCA